MSLREFEGPSPRPLTMRDIISPLFRHKWLFSICWIGLVLGSVIAAILLSQLYQSTMSILVNRQRVDTQVSTEQTTQISTSSVPVTEEEINAEVELLGSSDILRQIVLAHKLDVAERHSLWAWLMPKQKDPVYVDKAVQHLSKKLKAEPVTRANVISVKYRSGDPELCYAVLSELGQAYLQKHIEVNRPPGAYDFFARQADMYKNQLADSEARLRAYDSSQSAAASDVLRADLAAHLDTTMMALQQATDQIASDKEKIRSANSQMAAIPSRSLTAQMTGPADVLLQQLETSLLASKLKREQLTLKYNASYPLVREADQEISITEASIKQAGNEHYLTQTTDRDPTYELLRADAARAQTDLAGQIAFAKGLATDIEATKARLTDLDSKAITQAELLRNVKINESNYILYVGKREEARISDALDKTRISSVAIAVPPSIPALPAFNPLLVIAIGVVAATFLSVVSVYVAEYVDSSLRTPADVQSALGIPVLASFPRRAAYSGATL